MVTINHETVNTSFADPFRIWIYDDFLDLKQAKQLCEEFPKATDEWYTYNNVFEKKRAIDDITKMPDIHRQTLTKFNMGPALKWLETTTMISGLIPDPWLRGGGLHQISRGGKLDIHCDFNWHEKLKLDRRLNVLLYLNDDWHEDYGGYLECWDREMKECMVRILPKVNRLVIFETTDFSYHGHPEPLNCPEDRTRNSMAWYFYTNGRPEHEKSEAHSTMIQARPNDELSEEVEKFREIRSKGRV